MIERAKWIAAVVLALVMLPMLPPAHAYTPAVCGQAAVKTLYAGQTTNAGTVTVANDSANLYVAIETAGGWWLTETHVAIATSVAGIPQTKTGNPKIGNFPYSASHVPSVQSYVYTLDKAQLAASLGLETITDGSELTLAVHAVVVRYATDGNVTNTIQQETAWGNGTRFVAKGSWATYFTYSWQTCHRPPIVAGEFRTQTQGGWGATCRGSNPGCYRDAHFDAAFLDGVVVGGMHSITLTTADAVEAFLPQGGTPAALTGDRLNPTSTEAGVLAGQLVAATLNAVFDLRDPSFGNSTSNLKDLRVVDPTSPCVGWTVDQVLAEGNAVLGGAGTLTPAQVNSCLTGINEAFDNGTAVSGFLGW